MHEYIIGFDDKDISIIISAVRKLKIEVQSFGEV